MALLGVCVPLADSRFWRSSTSGCEDIRLSSCCRRDATRGWLIKNRTLEISASAPLQQLDKNGEKLAGGWSCRSEVRPTAVVQIRPQGSERAPQGPRSGSDPAQAAQSPEHHLTLQAASADRRKLLELQISSFIRLREPGGLLKGFY